MLLTRQEEISKRETQCIRIKSFTEPLEWTRSLQAQKTKNSKMKSMKALLIGFQSKHTEGPPCLGLALPGYFVSLKVLHLAVLHNWLLSILWSQPKYHHFREILY